MGASRMLVQRLPRWFWYLVPALLLLHAAPPAPAQTPSGAASLAGTWQGTLEVQGLRLRLVVTLTQDAATGALRGTLNSIDQGSGEIPIDRVTVDGEQLRLDIGRIGGRYEGRLQAGGERLAGTWSQGPGTLPLVLRREVTLPALNRPQEPRPPLPYRALEVAYDSEPGVRLAATLTLPPGPRPFPAVVLITGSGPQDRDEALAGHRPFAVLADALTRRGYAVLRADDRGVAQSTGDFAAATSESFATDALAGVRFLAARGDIRGDRIGLVGHSEGGLVAPLAAVRDVPEARQLAFLVLLAPPGVPLGEIIVEQTRAIATAGGAPPAAVQAQASVQRQLVEAVRDAPDTPAAQAAVRRLLLAQVQQLPEAARAGARERLDAQVQELTSPWMRWILAHDPPAVLRRVPLPVLAVFGGRDLQVLPAQNKPPLEAAVRAAGHADSRVVELPGLNHLLQAAATGLPTEYAQIEETINPAALQLVGDWLAARAGLAR